jgi:hypothetical protein
VVSVYPRPIPPCIAHGIKSPSSPECPRRPLTVLAAGEARSPP